jgi:predicted nuclease with TOPRIM domain
MSPVLIPLFGSLAGLVGVAALITAVRESAKWWTERKSNEIGLAVTSLSEVLTQIRAENTRLIDANDRKDQQLRESEAQIDRLEQENDRLEILVRSLSQQNMDAAQELLRERQQHRELMEKHNQLIGRLQSGGADVA